MSLLSVIPHSEQTNFLSLSFKLSLYVPQLVHKLKQQSTYYMWKNHHNYMAYWYCSGKHYLWTRGYFCSTIGEVSEQKLKEYIENQG